MPLRAIAARGNLDDYRNHHITRERQRNHPSRNHPSRNQHGLQLAA